MEGITLHYDYVVPRDSPNVNHIAWTKDGVSLSMDHSKYVGGSIEDRCLTITSPTADDAGQYTCTVANAVDAVSKSLLLGNIQYLS
jgi:hypothetical protein